jgi:hypothetical protein
MGSRVIRKPYYGIEEVCQRWEISQTDLAGFVIEQEIALAAVVPRVRVQFGTIEYDDDGQSHKMLEGCKYLSGAVDLLPLDGWYTLTTDFHPIHSFKSENGTYMDIVLERFDSSAFSVHRSQLVVRHAELTRFEAAQAAMEATPPIMQTLAAPQLAGRGAPAKYKWDDFYCALAVMTHADGVPETQTELIRRMMDWFAKQNLYPDPTTVKRKVAIFWRQYHEALAQSPA